MKWSDLAKKTMLSSVVSLLDGGTIEIHGTRSRLATLRLDTPAFDIPSNGPARLRPMFASKGDVSGTPVRFVALSATGSIIAEGSCGPGDDCDLITDGPRIEQGADVAVKRLTIVADA